MLYIHLAALFGLLLFSAGFLCRNHKRNPGSAAALFLFILAFALRLLCAGFSRGFDNDTACFAAWADRMFQVGPAGFYSDTVFTDYPPGYMYLLYPIGALRALLHVEYGSAGHLILLKLPAVFSDMACGLILYREAGRRPEKGMPLLFTAVYLLNPAVVLNSSVWGQVDSVYTLFLVILCLSLINKRTLPACISFFLGLLIKPQMLLFAPVLFVGLLNRVLTRPSADTQESSGEDVLGEEPSADTQESSLYRLLTVLGHGVLSLSAALLLILPFGLSNVLRQYLDTVGSYPYAAVNAYNFWGMLGLNWVSQDSTLLGLPCRFYGGAAIAVAVILILFQGIRRPGSRKPEPNYPLLASLFMATVFVFSVRMHERYLYPAVVLLLFACLIYPSKRLYLCYSGFSLLHFYNTAHVLFFYNPADYDRKAPLILLISGGTVLFLLLFWAGAVRAFRTGRPILPESQSDRDADPDYLYTPLNLALAPTASRPVVRLKGMDYACILVILSLYGFFAFRDLGSPEAPSTLLTLTEGESIVLEFDPASAQRLREFAYYMAPGHERRFLLSAADGSGIFRQAEEITLNNVFTWQKADLAALPSDTRQLRLTLNSRDASVLELVFLDDAGNILTPVNAEDYPALFDEQCLYPEEISFRNSMYFDEIYHARTAYEFLNGMTAYENTHPPLGKLFIAAGISVFGMNPFGWRIAGTLFGIAMIPFVYLFAKRVTDNIPLAALACFLFSFDFMHFTQTRLATIDVYITFFVILMYCFMYRYTCLSFYDTALKKTFLPLGACGVCMGLGIACKWTGVYAGIGLALIFFGVMLRRYREYRYAARDPEGSTAGISHGDILRRFAPHVLGTVLFCIVFFVVVPALIYLLSYLPFRDGTEDGLLLRLIRNQESMFRYHSTMDSPHPYSSSWYQWPIMQRPIWYYSRIVTGSSGAGGLREGISAFGNPLVWWAGIPAALYTLCLLIRNRCLRHGQLSQTAPEKDRTAAFLLTGYLAQYLPWFFVTRVTFIYHYFPSVVFVVLMIVFCLSGLREKLKGKTFVLLLCLYGLAAFGLFLLFYPVLSGQPVEAAFVNRFLRWFKSWVLAAK